MDSKVGLAVVGDVLDINTWSNVPYYFFRAAQKANLLSLPWRLDLSRVHTRRKIWNVIQLLAGRGVGGFQYSTAFLDWSEAQIPASYFSASVISMNQLFPRARQVMNAGGKIYYYVDATLYDLFREESYGIKIPERMRGSALAQEKENYQKAEGIVTMGSWVHHALTNYYGIPASKLVHIMPGANIEIPEQFHFSSFQSGAGITRELVLGFIGKDWKRKGLPILLNVRDVLATRGYKVKVVAVGHCPDELKNRPGFYYTGFIDKTLENEKLLSILESCDIGCLFSTSEALGLSTLEFIQCGIPVAGYYHQGLRDTLLPGCSLRFDLTTSVDEIANEFEKFILDEQIQRSMKHQAERYHYHVSWDRCVDDFKKVLNS